MRSLLLVLLAVLPLGAQQGRAPVIQLANDSTRIIEYAAPPIYYKWWIEIAECEELSFSPDDVISLQFFEVKGADFTPSGGEPDLGAAFPKEHQIFVATPYIWNEELIKHEMTHVLLWSNGYEFGHWHPAEFFCRCGLVPWGVSE